MFLTFNLSLPSCSTFWALRLTWMCFLNKQSLCGSPDSSLERWGRSLKLCWWTRQQKGFQPESQNPIQDSKTNSHFLSRSRSHMSRDKDRSHVYSSVCLLIRHISLLLFQPWAHHFPVEYFLADSVSSRQANYISGESVFVMILQEFFCLPKSSPPNTNPNLELKFSPRSMVDDALLVR